MTKNTLGLTGASFVGYNDAEFYAISVWIHPADGQSVH